MNGIDLSITHDEPKTAMVLVFGELLFKTVQYSTVPCRIHPCIPWCDIKSIGVARTDRLGHGIATRPGSIPFRSSLRCVVIYDLLFAGDHGLRTIPHRTVPYKQL
uniref:Uncharacterized protein n=1 Tax=Pseudo-nitzschia australis TaxID=44445 RepID=A0A7S4AIJ0_9STRA